MKTAIRLTPVDLYDVAQAEAYYSYMASKGLHLKKQRGILSTFEKGEAEKARYRLELIAEMMMEPPEEMLLFYKEQGWKFICKTGCVCIYKSTGEAVTELHTDPIVQGMALEETCRKLKNYVWSTVILCLFTGGLILYSLFSGHPVYNNARDGFGLSMVILIIMNCIMILYSTQSYRKIKKIKVQLNAGLSLLHGEEYKFGQFRFFTRMLLPLLLPGLMFYMNYYSDKLRWEENLSKYEGKRPTISIAALERSPSLSLEYGDSEINGNISYISYNWSELASAAYRIEERGLVHGQMWKDSSGTYSPSMEAEYFEMRSIFLAKMMYKDLLERKMDRSFYKTVEYKQLYDSAFDQAVLASSEETQMLFARAGKKVIFQKYYGNESLEAVVDDIYEAICIFNEK